MTPGDRVAQLYPQALGTHFSRLLRHAWVTVGLFFNPGHHMGNVNSSNNYINDDYDNYFLSNFILSLGHVGLLV
jgi:hypothetical protein